MERKDVIPELKCLEPGDHLCHFYTDPAERDEVAVTYFHLGLDRGEKILYRGKATTWRKILVALRREGHDVDSLLARGELSFFDSREAHPPGKPFDARAALEFLEGEAAQCAAEGWPALRVLGDMSWVVDRSGDWKEMARFEAEINRLPSAKSCIFLCQFGSGLLDPSFQLELLYTHPKVLVEKEVYDNVFYRPPGEYLGNMHSRSVLSHHLDNLKERKRALLQIDEAREFAEAIVDTVREPMLVLDAALRVVSANRSFYRTFRTMPEETEGRPVYELGERQWDIPALRRLLEEIIPLNSHFEGYPVEHEFAHLGKRVMLLNARRLIRRERGEDLILLAFEDVTDRQRAVEELRRREEYFQALVENAFDAVTVLDGEARHVYASPSVERVLGWRPEELLGRTPFEFMDPEELPAVLEAFMKGMEEPGTVHRVVHRWRGSDGTWRVVESLGSNLLHEPSIRGVVINCRDITRHRLAEERVHRLNRMFLSLGADFLANMETVIRACKEILEGDAAVYARLEEEKLALLTTLPGEEGFFFLQEGDRFAGHPLLSGSHPRPLVIREGAESPLEEDPLAKAHGYSLFLGQPVIFGERTKGALGVYYSGERPFSEEDLETLIILSRTLAVEEERLARERGLKEFIDVASHELRHPITLIKGFALSLKERNEMLSERQKLDLLTAIDQGADRLTRLVENLLDVSRIERGQLEPDLRPAELLPLIRHAVNEIRTAGKDVSLHLKANPGACLLDPDRFLEVVYILLENAVKFSPSDSPVDVEVEEREFEYMVSVTDRGIGIPEEERERIFDRFYQVEKARYHSKPGMGMGLYIAREIIERHGGRIWHEPREGGGSVFRFTIPR
ncbi:MEDS domain-containing protein [Candidatus Solincola tengchongensis]|uniref:MEDS domain-containing protein n=1 Tax=Candidatus Solincola tengchongensis TaxID=2900693 RepID=UPI00257C36A4|nr:MEDS domain-containing protein [Candidatus Solincola tengchongensis]